MDIKTALVVDDSRVARLTLTKLLKGRRIEVDQANSAQEALDYLKKQRPDVVFMDYMMPDMDGFEATRLISTDPATASIPVIICTAEETAGIVHQAQGKGAWGFLTKPAPEERLDKLLEDLSRQSPAVRTPNSTPVLPGITLQEVEKKAWEVAETTWQRSAPGMIKRLIDDSVRPLIESQRAALEQALLETVKKAACETAQSVAEVSAKIIARQVAQDVANETGANAAYAAAETVVRREIKLASGQLTESIRHELDIRLDEFNNGGTHEELINMATAAAAQAAESVAKSTAHHTAVEAVQAQHRHTQRTLSEGQMNALTDIKAQAQRAVSMARKLLLVSGLILMVSLGSTVLAVLR